MEKQTDKNWYMFLIRGIFIGLLSLFVLINPKDSLKTIAFFLGIGFFITGMILVIRYISAKKSEENWNWNIIEGITDLILGFLLIVAPLALAALIPIMLGIGAAFYSILIIIDAFKGAGNGPLKLVSGIIIFLLAYLVIFNPLLLGLTIVVWLGILLLVAGIFNIILAIKLKQQAKKNV